MAGVSAQATVAPEAASAELRLSRYDASELSWLAAMLSDEHDLKLVWPDARFPFDVEQWRERLTRSPGNGYFQVCRGAAVIGHAALLETEQPDMLSVSFLYIAPTHRGAGLGSWLIAAVEACARKREGIRMLRLRVRSYNPRALHIYRKAGFREIERDDALVIMRKKLN
jgi:ribosomal-protein-alanine N-acetyltransferase